MNHFYDTSALIKRYHSEVGTQAVNALIAPRSSKHLISRLSVVELHSALAKKVRQGYLTYNEFVILSQRFRSEVRGQQFEVHRLLVKHFQTAEQLIRRIGPTQNLRSLDALQLTVALDLNITSQPIIFVSADQALCTIAQAEGLAVINPEIP